MTRSDQLNKRAHLSFAYVRFGRHITPSGNRCGYAGYSHAGAITFLGRTFDCACETIDCWQGVWDGRAGSEVEDA
jgi:hypothetical protein